MHLSRIRFLAVLAFMAMAACLSDLVPTVHADDKIEREKIGDVLHRIAEKNLYTICNDTTSDGDWIQVYYYASEVQVLWNGNFVDGGYSDNGLTIEFMGEVQDKSGNWLQIDLFVNDQGNLAVQYTLNGRGGRGIIDSTSGEIKDIYVCKCVGWNQKGPCRPVDCNEVGTTCGAQGLGFCQWRYATPNITPDAWQYDLPQGELLSQNYSFPPPVSVADPNPK